SRYPRPDRYGALPSSGGVGLSGSVRVADSETRSGAGHVTEHGPSAVTRRDRRGGRSPEQPVTKDRKPSTKTTRRTSRTTRPPEGVQPSADPPDQVDVAPSTSGESRRPSRTRAAVGTGRALGRTGAARSVTGGSAARTYVLDTSVLLSDPRAILRFAEHEVVLPLVVITELEGKRHHPELGGFARHALRILDDLRVEHGRLDQPLSVNDHGGTLRVELNHADQSALPVGFRADTNDARILSVAMALAAEGREVTLVTKDIPLRVKAAAVGLVADEYRHGQASDPTWTGTAELELSDEERNSLYAGEALEHPAAAELPTHTGLVLHSSNGSALGRIHPDKKVRLVRGDREAFGLRGRSAEQRIALDLLLDDSIGIVSLGGRAGTGKSALALCAGLEQVMERGRHRKISVFRPLYAVGGQELGYLPGTESEKMSPWAQAVFDTLGAVVHENVVEEVLARGLLEVLPLTHVRGRSLHDTFVIIDEAQSLERGVLL